jgi:membrane protease YdiL (CAAX protease family)
MPAPELRALLERHRWARVAELLLAFGIPLTALSILQPMADGPLAAQVVVWVANVLMLSLVWIDLRVRGDTGASLGLLRIDGSVRTLLRLAGSSLLTLLAAVLAFVAGSVLAANIVGVPGDADLSGYAYLEDNLPMLLLALSGAYLVSSFGEEVVYRGFLIRRLAELWDGEPRWWPAVVAGGVLFGLAHYAWGFMGMVQTTFMGIALGAAYLKVGRNLWVPILAHAVMDTALFVQLYLGP